MKRVLGLIIFFVAQIVSLQGMDYSSQSLIQKIAESDKKAVQIMIKNNPNCIDEVDLKSGLTSLGYAINKYHETKLSGKMLDIIEILLKNGANPNLYTINNGVRDECALYRSINHQGLSRNSDKCYQLYSLLYFYGADPKKGIDVFLPSGNSTQKVTLSVYHSILKSLLSCILYDNEVSFERSRDRLKIALLTLNFLDEPRYSYLDDAIACSIVDKKSVQPLIDTLKHEKFSSLFKNLISEIEDSIYNKRYDFCKNFLFELQSRELTGNGKQLERLMPQPFVFNSIYYSVPIIKKK